MKQTEGGSLMEDLQQFFEVRTNRRPLLIGSQESPNTTRKTQPLTWKPILNSLTP